MTSIKPSGVTEWAEEVCRRIVRDLSSEGHSATHVYGFAPWPDHNNRRCLDIMLPTLRDVKWAALYVARHARALDVELIIANRQIWRSYRKGPWRARSWAPYFGRNPHRDHVHLQVSR